MVAHIFTALFTGLVIYTAWPGSSLFSWHPTLMTFGFVVGMFEAMMVFNKESSLFLNSAHGVKVLAHHCLQVFAIVSSLLGFAAIYYNKERNDKPHFTTWHGLFGVITVCTVPLAAVGGNLVKYKGLRDMIGLKQSLGDLKIMHATGGLMAFTLVMSTMMLGLYSEWYSTTANDVVWFISMMCVSFMAVVVMNQVVTEYLPRTRKRPPTQQSAGDAKKSKSGKRK